MANCSKKPIRSKADPAYVKAQVEKFTPVTISYEENILDERETEALKKIVEAAKYMDEIFLRQVYSKNDAIKEALMESTDPADTLYQELFAIMFGPFDRLEEDNPFINKSGLASKVGWSHSSLEKFCNTGIGGDEKVRQLGELLRSLGFLDDVDHAMAEQLRALADILDSASFGMDAKITYWKTFVRAMFKGLRAHTAALKECERKRAQSIGGE